MTYNHKKNLNKIAESSPQNREGALQSYNKDWKNTLPESIPNYNGLLSESRSKSEPDQSLEAMMDKTRKNAADADGRTTEGQLDKRESYQVHRDAEHMDDSPMPPINALSGTYDAKFQQAYGKKSKSVARKYLDKKPGSQMDGPKTTVPANMPESGSQIQNGPSRFLDSKNAETAALHVADRSLFEIYYKAASEDRDLTTAEKEIESKIVHDKKVILANMGQPPVAPFQDPQQGVPGSQNAPEHLLQDPSNPNHPHGSVHSEFYPSALPGENSEADPLGEEEVEIDDQIIDQLLNGTPNGGIGGEDIRNPHYKNIHEQEMQEMQHDPLEDMTGQQEMPRF